MRPIDLAPAAFLLALAGTLSAQSLTRGPSVWTHTGSSFLVAFQSSAAAVGEVQWGTTPALGQAVRGPSTTDHAIEIRGLAPDRFHWYRVLLGGQPVTAVHRTRTLAAPGCSDLSFFVVGDTGAATADQLRIADLLTRWTFDLGILPGDIIYEGGERQNFDPRFFVPYAPLLKETPFFPVLGNHDVVTENGKPFFEAFYLPTKNSGTEQWFSFDAGDIHFVGLDGNNYVFPPQTAWLRSDLTAARARGARWIFVFFHHPGYSSGRGGDQGIRDNWCPIFEEFEVDAVFNGHDHHYERTRVIRDFYPGKRGVVYFVAGTGGRGLHPVGPLQPYSAFAAQEFGVLKVEVRGDVLRTAFLDGSDAGFRGEIDAWTLVRGPVTPALRAASVNPAPGEVFRGAADAGAGSVAIVLFAARPGWLPLLGLGIYHLAPGNELVQGALLMGAAETAPFSLAVPRDASLKGLDLFFQAATLRLSPWTATLTDLLVSRVR